MANDEIILLDFWSSPYGKRVKIALAEKGVEYECREEEGLLANIKSPLLLNSNPVYKKIPVLIHHGKPVCESLIIMQYIDEAWKERSSTLLPQDPYLRAKARFWADFIDNKIIESGQRVWRCRGEIQATARCELIEQLKLMECELGEKPYFGGETFGYTDIALIAFTPWLYVYAEEGKFSIEEECPKLKSWMERCTKRESVAKNNPENEKIYEYVSYLKKNLGLE